MTGPIGSGRPLPFGTNYDGEPERTAAEEPRSAAEEAAADIPGAEPALAHGNQAVTLDTPPGGIMCDEVGAVTGRVELFVEHEVARLRYEGAIDVYRVTGDVNGRSLDEVVTQLTTDPGNDEDGNPKPTSL